MIKKEDDVKNNSMKLYSYLLCISGLAIFPENTRMFRHKDLVLSKIKRCTGITDKTVKLYLYELENAGLISYMGVNMHERTLEFDRYHGDNEIYEEDFIIYKDGVPKLDKDGHPKIDKVAFRKAKESRAFEIWKNRNKKGVYYIPRPNPYTPIPEETLEKLISIFELDEQELKTYIMCCIFRDVQVEHYGGKSKVLKYEDLRETLGKRGNISYTDSKIKRTLYLLKGLGLINFDDGFCYNQKGAKIPCFILTYVGYYVAYEEKEFENENNDEDIAIAQERLKQYDKSLFECGRCI